MTHCLTVPKRGYSCAIWRKFGVKVGTISVAWSGLAKLEERWSPYALRLGKTGSLFYSRPHA